MPLVFITGIAGSGKSAVKKELIKRGHEAYDTDNDGYTAWYKRGTDDEVESPEEEWGSRTPEFYQDHEWKTSAAKVKQLAERATGIIIFICGTNSNRKEIMDIADLTICLTVDEETLKERIRTRKNIYGKQAHELENILDWRVTSLEQDKADGAVVFDSGVPLTELVDQILERVKSV